MEFPDTYRVIEQTKRECEKEGVKFYIAKSDLKPKDTWSVIGPPAQKLRWCCSVHKTAPQILFLRQLTHNPHFRGMGIIGVRADESITRSKYLEINFGTKHRGQYDFYPILDWNTAELFLYTYQNHLIINDAYKCGSNRAGCLVCPMATNKSLWIRSQLYGSNADYEHSTSMFFDKILENTIARNMPKKKQQEFMEVDAWKSRHNGEKLAAASELIHESTTSSDISITILKETTSWREWIKTIGTVVNVNDSIVKVCFQDEWFTINVAKNGSAITFSMHQSVTNKSTILFVSALKNVLRKSAYCITCKVCQANCPNGFIHMKNGQVEIDDKCVHCMQCHKVSTSSCWVAESTMPAKGGKKAMTSIDRYKTLGVQYSWVHDYFQKKDEFWNDNSLGTMMLAPLKLFLSDSGVLNRKHITKFGEIVAELGVDNQSAWALMLCNAVYTSEFNWWVKNLAINQTYTPEDISAKLRDYIPSAKSHSNIINALKKTCQDNNALMEIGFANCVIESKGKVTVLSSFTRTPWKTPDPRVILYSLYRFAEACGEYYQFTLSRLMDTSIESDGVSPVEIFGLSEDTMKKLLQGLAINYPQLISVSFTLDLDNIELKCRKEPGEGTQDYMERIASEIFA